MEDDAKEWTDLIIRFSEIWLKSPPTRRKLLKRLSAGVKRAAGEAPELRRTRLFLPYSSRAVGALSRVFGVASFSPAMKVGLGELEGRFEELARRHVRGRTFRVTVQRTWKGYPKDSMQLERELGALAGAYGKVDLKGYEVNLEVEVHRGHAYLFTDRMPGPGGLPYGSEGRVLALFSGGIDSPVAAWMAARRGAEVVPVFLNPLGKVLETEVQGVFATLSPWLPGAVLQVADISVPVAQIRERVDEGMRQVVYKRLMYRVASGLARKLDCKAVVTGENLGQVSSQTLQSLVVIDGAADVPVFRPLLGMDKEEISALARRVGTFDSSSAMQEFCSLEGHSNASPGMGETLEQERRLDPPGELRVRPASPVELPDFAPPGGSLEVVRMWQGVPELEKGKRYLFVCELGVRAREAAFRARHEGVEAYALDRAAAARRKLL